MARESIAVRSGRIGGLITAAKHGAGAFSAPGIAAAARTLDARVTAELGLDVNAPDYAERLALGRRAHFLAIGLKASRKGRKRARS